MAYPPAKVIKILHTPTLTGNNPGVLAEAERALGLDSVCANLYPSRFGFKTDEQVWQPGDSLVLCEWKRWRLFCRAARDFDVIHFNFGRAFAPPIIPWSNYHHHFPRKSLKKLLYCLYAYLIGYKDLWLLKCLGKKIVVTFQGDDCRINEYCERHFQYHINAYSPEEYRTPAWDRVRRKTITAFDRYADTIYALNPDLLRFLPARAQFLPYASVDPRQWLPSFAIHTNNPLILHAPTHRYAKGTDFILRAIETLRNEGLDFRFRLIENMPHAEAHKCYEEADLFIDQLRAGWYGGVAVELMSIGKPVMAYLREEDLGFLPAKMKEDLPLINVNPDTITDVLREWLTVRKHELPQKGNESRRFVEAWHDPQKIAQRIKSDYENLLAGQ